MTDHPDSAAGRKVRPDFPRFSRLKSWEAVLLMAALAVAFAGFLTSWQDMKTFGGVDLVARLTGSYALKRGFDPYFHTLEQEATFPVQCPGRDDFISRCTYPPSLLYLYTLTGRYKYMAQRWIWFGVEWSLMLIAIGAASLLAPRRGPRVLFGAAALFFFAGGTFWRLHVERGQYYILVAALMSLALFMVLKCRRRSWVGSLVHGLVISWRPTMIMASLPRAISLQRRGWLHALLPIVTALVVTGLLAAKFGIVPFRNYATMAAYWQKESLGIQEFDSQSVIPMETPDISSAKKRTMSRKLTRYVGNMLNIAPAETSFGRWVAGMVRERGTAIGRAEALRIIWWNKVAVLAYLALASGFLASMALTGKRGTARLQLAAGLLVSITLGHMAPVRWEYADVVYLPLLALLSPQIFSVRGIYLVSTGILLTGFALGNLPIDITTTWPGQARSACVLLAGHMLVVGAYLRYPRGRGIIGHLRQALAWRKPRTVVAPSVSKHAASPGAR